MQTDQEIPMIEVGVLFSPRIRFRLNGTYRSHGKSYRGAYEIARTGEGYTLTQGTTAIPVPLPLLLEPEDGANADFDLLDVTIGIRFHWERREDQKFKGALRLIDEGEHLTAVNILPLEEYLASVISSEMKATSNPELLKAHAVISRSWLLAQKAKAGKAREGYCSCLRTEEEYIRWYDREDHLRFDVCADDHCQRYQGITKASTAAVREAVEATRGEVLVHEGKICDARFSKCCGGMTERFENTWETVAHPYLDAVYDAPGGTTPRQAADAAGYNTEGTRTGMPADLSTEEGATAWILGFPAAFCNTEDTRILADVLNDYDLETRHFFRWQVSYTAAELSELVREKTGIDFGTVTDLQPVERGASGRLVRLRIVGTRHSLVIGKELFIRKALSPTHLYSSAFIVRREGGGFLLHGAGWGHGVGLCQIGAAVMGAQGYGYRQILLHYFPGAQLAPGYGRDAD